MQVYRWIYWIYLNTVEGNTTDYKNTVGLKVLSKF
jgi:hypothetical protein